ncbi:acetylajmaline esterase [Salvia divinorum]|uniref:Acetylajmaline esterase n=1 Tax=Salvia divinorum TaxID=28513 RepID=A0ABD1G329_SALDI
MKSLKIIAFLLFIAAGTASAQNRNNAKCPFQFLYHFGDAISDTGNSVRVQPSGPLLPPTRDPYGVTFPGSPTGRWSDGRVDIDYVAEAVGLPNIVPYLSTNASRSIDGVIFSVAGSTALNTSFFESRGIAIPPYNTPLDTQLTWFRSYLQSNCTNQTECAKRQPSNSAVLFEFSELNDIGYALVQGKSIQEVTNYVPLLVDAQIKAAREAIGLGATRVVYTTAAPLGCYPYILTALTTNDTSAYDGLGCLTAVNNVAVKFNNNLTASFLALKAEFPTVNILSADYYATVRGLITLKTPLSSGRRNPALRTCCGVGGSYNYDSSRLCGSPNVTACPNPNNSIYWDGLHFTQRVYRNVIGIQIIPALLLLKCRLI